MTGHIIFGIYSLSPTLMVHTILITSFNHILLCLGTFEFYCGSFAVNWVAVLIALEAVKAIQT